MLDDGGGVLTGEEVDAGIAAAAAATQAEEDAYYTQKVGNTGKTQAQLDAYQNAIDTMTLINSTQPNSVTMNPDTGYLTYTPQKPNPIPTPKPNPIFTPVQTANPVVNPTPNNPPSNPPQPPPPPIKTATPQYVTFNDDEVPIDLIVDLLFENVGGQELLSVSRHDTVLGQKILYQPFKNLNIIKEEYNPNNLVRLQQTSDKFFANYTIKLSERIPVVGNGSNGDNVYLDADGNMVIEFININNDEQVEVQITSNGTIYEAGI
jgi:hypothetical protein